MARFGSGKLGRQIISAGLMRDLMKISLNKAYGQVDNSVCVQTHSYDPESNELTIVFQERGTYLYKGVPITEYANFSLSSSLGQYFNNYIRDQYEYERIA